jgi:hypothetical protein
LIYICIPTHNEQQTVGVVLWKLRQVLTDFPRDYQLLVADDASTDKTPQVLEPYTRVLPLTVIRSDQRQGCAASLEMLLREAVRRSEYPKRDVIVTLQADFSEEPDDLVPLVKRLEAGADVAVGNKMSTTKEARTRRFARSLASFFTRRQKWPEGVMTPFDGYRAYRLHAVKRAMEDRGQSRLIRHDGWAGHAELLKAVLPHARRIDVIDIEDRPDRLQRPRREKPFAAAMQVRVMAAGGEPQGLAGVEDLDRIAQTASRRRERAAVTPQSINAERGTGLRTNGSRTRQTAGPRRDQGRSRNQANGSGRGAGAEAGESRTRRDRTKQPEARRQKPERSSGGRPGRPRRQDEGTRRQPGSTEPGAAPEEASPSDPLTAEGTAAPETAVPKRKRRRRKRSGQGRAAGASADQNAAQEAGQQDQPPGRGPAEAASGAPAAAAPHEGPEAESGATQASEIDAVAGTGADDVEDSGAAGDANGKKRRRRGGRRGGRGRRRPRQDGATEAGPEGAGETGPATAGEPENAESGRAGARATGPEDTGGAAMVPSARPVGEPAARAEND